jgi:hypothetical protein
VAVLLLTAGFAVLPAQAPACACSCVAMSEQEHFASADTVFTGVVAAVQRGDKNRITFAVESVRKGEAGKQITLSTEQGEAACGMNFVVGERLEIYGREGQTGICSGNLLLGQSTVPPGIAAEPDNPAGGGDSLPGILGVTALMAMAGLIAYVLYRRLRAAPGRQSPAVSWPHADPSDRPAS